MFAVVSALGVVVAVEDEGENEADARIWLRKGARETGGLVDVNVALLVTTAAARDDALRKVRSWKDLAKRGLRHVMISKLAVTATTGQLLFARASKTGV